VGNLDTGKLNEVQLFPVVGQMLLAGKFSELAEMAAGDSRVLRQLEATLLSGRDPMYLSAAASLARCGEKGVDPLLKALGEPVPQVPLGMGAQLLGMKQKKGLHTAGQNPSIPVRQAAAMALGETGSSRIVEPLIKALGDVSPLVRQTAAHSLGVARAVSAVEPLKKLAADGDATVRKAAEKALELIRSSRDV
jgi:HEAT repeat protein